jgi:predicted nucleotidyltransferase
MYTHEKKTLTDTTQLLKKKLPDRIIAVYAFGSRVRGDYNAWSDFDILVIVKDKTPELESEIIGIIVDEERRRELSFSPVVKDVRAFDRERSLHTPFYENIMKEGVEL